MVFFENENLLDAHDLFIYISRKTRISFGDHISEAFPPKPEICLEAKPLSLLMITQEVFVDSVDQDQTAHNVQSDLDLHSPHFRSRL